MNLKIKNKMRTKLIFVFVAFAAFVISVVLSLLYMNLTSKVDNFNKGIIEGHQKVLMDMLNKSKSNGKTMILESNSKVVEHTKEQINIFVKKASKEQNISLLKTISLALDLEIKSARELLMNNADSPAFYWQYDLKEREVLTNIMKKDPYFGGFVILFESGEVLMKIGDISEKMDMRNIYSTTKSKEIYVSSLDKRSEFYIAVPIINETGKYRGALVAKVKLKKLLEYVFERIDLGIEKTIFIVDDNKTIIKHKYKENEGKIFREISISKSEEFSQYINSKQNSIYNVYKYNKNIVFYIVIKEYIADSFSYVDTIKNDAEQIINESFNQFDNTLKKEARKSYEITRVKSKVELEDFGKELLGILYFIIGFSVIIAILIGVLLANYITQPIKELAVAAKKIGDGNLDYKINNNLTHKNDEIGMLAKEFSDMQIKIKNAIENNRELERKKAQADRLSVVGQMASGIVHEIKNPLTSISGFAQIINEMTEDKTIKNNSQIIISETERLNKLTLEMLNYAKPSKLTVQEIDVETLLRDNVNVLYPKAMAKKVGVNLDLDMELGKIMGDKDKLTQVFINIMANGIEAVEGVTGLVTIIAKRHGDELLLEFSDNGHGIPKNIKEKLFMPFVSGKQTGTGLGLAMAKKIIDEHMGEITVETSEKGTSFFIKLYSNLNIEE